MNGQSQFHPGWCMNAHSSEEAHASQPITLDQGAGYTSAVLYLWRPPGSPVMIAMELSGDGHEEALLYLFSIEEAERLQEAVQQLAEISSGQDSRAADRA